MTKAEEMFLLILKGVCHPDLTHSCTVDAEADWSAVLDTARKQNLFPLVYDAAASNASFDEFASQHPDYFTAAALSVSAQIRKTEAFLELYRAFLAAGIEPVAMKGIICRSLYGTRGDLRPSGDEDILIEKKDYARSTAVLEACNFHAEIQPDREMAIIQEVAFHSPDLVVEMHLNLFGTKNAGREKMNEWFENVVQDSETVVIQGVPVRTMSPTDHLMYLVFHMFKHLTGCGSGIRMMLDILLYLEKYDARIDWARLEDGLTGIHASGFFSDLVHIGNRYLGFTIPEHGNIVCPEALLEDMFRVGTFGNLSERDRITGLITGNAVQREFKGSVLTMYTQLLFPSWRSWTSWKPSLSDRPWMLPVEWVKRLVRLLREHGIVQNIVLSREGAKASNDRIALLEKYGIL